MPGGPSWELFDWFERARPALSWASVDELARLVHEQAASQCAPFAALLTEWDTLLADLGGDPCHSDWSSFRPLRQDREEDWSDWLAHFIGTSTSGAFAASLFKREALASVSPDVMREDVVEGRRADVVIAWADGTATHIEVKVGDQAFSKTTETAAALEQKHADMRAWSHYLLLPSEDLGTWRMSTSAEGTSIHAITWDDVAIALRSALRERDETMRWRFWAHGFCGLIEQLQLGHPRATSAGAVSLGPRLRQIAHLTRGRPHE